LKVEVRVQVRGLSYFPISAEFMALPLNLYCDMQ